MNLLTLWIAVAAVTAIVVVTAQTLWDYHQRHREAKAAAKRRHPATQYYGWDLTEAIKGIEPVGSIDELRIPGLTEEEADEFWHAVND